MLKTFSFDETKDKDILDHLNSLAETGKASEFVRNAIRMAMDEERVSLSTILDEIREIKRNGIVASSTNGKSEPEDIVINLDKLGL